MEPPPAPKPRSPPALVGLLLLALLYTLYLTAEIVLPVLVASLLALVLGPLAVRLKRWGLPRGIAAAIVTAAFVAAIGWGVQMLATPAAQWLERAPQSFGEIERKLRPVKEPVEQVQRATKQVERLAGGEDDDRNTVSVKGFDLGRLFVVSAGQLLAQSLVVVVLLYFLLASGER
ncbi:MAG TPA: AI-2E family transporter, partial [Candidatus Omnitrophota bacterium]|nr:AI-2E family transporter [Candidatus Omnitrophota bacterium]